MWNKTLFCAYYFAFRTISFFVKTNYSSLPEVLNNILIFSTAGIGDTLSDSPAIKAVKRSFPAVTLDVVVHKRRADIAYHNPFIDNIFLYKKGILSFFKLVLTLKRKKYDAVIILRANDPDIWPLAYLVNRKAVISDPKRTRMPFLISHPVSIPEWDRMHGVEQTLSIVKYIGVNIDDKSMVYASTEKEMSVAEKILSKAELIDTDIIAFQVGGGKKKIYRDWSAENYALLGEMFLRDYHGSIILLGGKENILKGMAIQKMLTVKNYVGKLTISQTAAILRKCKILVSTDTGIMHLGFAVGVPTLALLHYLHPSSRVGPCGYEEEHIVVQLEHPGTKDIIALDTLSPKRVYENLKLLCERNGIKRKNESKD